MRLLFVVDGRSPIALNWIEYFAHTGHEVYLVSTAPCAPQLPLASLSISPLAFGESGAEQTPHKAADSLSPGGGGNEGRTSILRTLIPVGMRTGLKQRLVPRKLPAAARHLQQLISEIKPDLVHAMRIPYEGMLAALADPPCPLVVSVWGNDFTLHAPATRRMTHLTHLTLRRADALHTDCERDQRLAIAWGYPAQQPAITLPGAGGIRREVFKPKSAGRAGKETDFLIINPRGVRAYVRNDTFFRAIPKVIAEAPQTRIICPAMAGESGILHWVEKLDISRAVTLLPRLNQTDMANLFNQADIAVSITEHDGTPNTLLEAMACGCIPIAGDIETIREWITPGVNGLLAPPGDPQAVAEAILTAIAQPDLCSRAQEINLQLIKDRADYTKVMPQALDFYESIIS